VAYTETGNHQIFLAGVLQKMREQGERKALRTGAEVMRVAMETATPVQAGRSLGSDSLDVGEMKENIRVKLAKDEGEQVALIGPMGEDGRIAKAAYLVEYGHRMVVGGKSRLNAAGQFVGSGHALEQDVPPHPFLRPSYEASVRESLEAVAVVCTEELRKAADGR
jgi:hypothetical protein